MGWAKCGIPLFGEVGDGELSTLAGCGDVMAESCAAVTGLTSTSGLLLVAVVAVLEVLIFVLESAADAYDALRLVEVAEAVCAGLLPNTGKSSTLGGGV